VKNNPERESHNCLKSKFSLGLFLFCFLFSISNPNFCQENNYSLEWLQKDLTTNNFTNIEKNETWIRNHGLKMMADDYLRFYVSYKLYEHFKNQNNEQKKYYYGDLLGVYSAYTSQIYPDFAIEGLMTSTYENLQANNYNRAIYHEDRGLSLIDSIYGKKHELYKSFLSVSATSNSMVKNYPKSKQRYFELLSICEVKDDEYYENLKGLAGCYSALSDNEKAEKLTFSAYKYFQSKYGHDNEQTRDSEISLIQLYLFNGKLDTLLYHFSLTNFEERVSRYSDEYKLAALEELALYFTLFAEKILLNDSKDQKEVLKFVRKSEKFISQIETVRKKVDNPSLVLDLAHDLEIVNGMNNYLSFKDQHVQFNNKDFATLSLQFYFGLRSQNRVNSKIVLMDLMQDRLNFIDSYLSSISYEQVTKLKATQSRYFTTLPFEFMKNEKTQDENFKKYVINNWLDFKGKLDASIKQQNTILRSLKTDELEKLNTDILGLQNRLFSAIKLKQPDIIEIIQLEDSIDYLKQEKVKFIDGSFIKPKCDIEQIQQFLRPDEIYIDIVRTEGKLNSTDASINTDSSGYYYFAITKNDLSDVIFNNIDPEKEEEILSLYRSNLKTDFNINSNPDILFLSNKLWGPIGQLSKNCRKIILSVDGIYNAINLNILLTSENQNLIDRFQIDLTYSSYFFLESRSPNDEKPPHGNVVLMGNPDFSCKIASSKGSVLTSTNREWNGWTLVEPLPSTLTEINNIQNTVKSQNWETSIFSGSNATSENLLNLHSPRVLHIATHGFFLKQENKPNMSLFSKSNSLDQTSFDQRLSSGLLFSGINQSIMEKSNEIIGVVTSDEISRLDLSETELVVLSACESGVGISKNSESPKSIGAAFQLAGAQNIIMSLWKVDDKVTQEFMTRFYEIWLNEKTSIREAFNRTQFEIKAKYPQPYYWGAFILVGNKL
jgi:CHAT domain-containing protein